MILGDKNIINDPDAKIDKNFITPNLKPIIKDKAFIRYEQEESIPFIEVDPSKVKLHIVTWADVDKRTFMCWGDYWVKKNLEEAFINIGYDVIDDVHQADVNIYLFGSPFTNNRNLFNPNSYNIVWLYSHPDKVTASEFSKYNEVFVLSEYFIKEMAKIYLGKLNVKPLYSCSNFMIPDNIEYGESDDLVIVANARGAGAPYGREVVKYLTIIKPYLPFKVKIWGHKWDLDKYDAYPREWFVEKYYDYYSLPRLYRSAKAVLIDGHDDMQRLGFVPMKLFDVYASGGLPIIESNSGISEIFDDFTLQYSNEKQLKDIIDFVKNEKQACNDIIMKGNKIAKEYTYASVASIFDNSIKSRSKVQKSNGNKSEKRIIIDNDEQSDVADEIRYISSRNRKGIIRI